MSCWLVCSQNHACFCGHKPQFSLRRSTLNDSSNLCQLGGLPFAWVPPPRTLTLTLVYLCDARGRRVPAAPFLHACYRTGVRRESLDLFHIFKHGSLFDWMLRTTHACIRLFAWAMTYVGFVVISILRSLLRPSFRRLFSMLLFYVVLVGIREDGSPIKPRRPPRQRNPVGHLLFSLLLS